MILPNHELSTSLGMFCAFASSCTWAVGVSYYSFLAKSHSGYAINLARALISFCLFFVWVLLVEVKLDANAPWDFVGTLVALFGQFSFTQIIWLAVSVICSYGLGDIVFFRSTKYLGGPAALAIASIFPAVAAIWGWLVDGHHLSLSSLLGLGLTILGTILVILDSGQTSANTANTARPSQKNIVLGLILALLTAALWAGNAICVGRVGHSMPPGALNVIRMGMSALFCAFFLVKTSPRDFRKFSFRPFKPYIFVFVLESFGGALTYTYGLGHTPLAVGATLSSLAPVLMVPVTLIRKTEKYPSRKPAEFLRSQREFVSY